MLKEFREFAMRGNVVDLAVGIILGAAFGAIVTSLVNDVVMPPIGLLLGGVDFSNLFIALSVPAGVDMATINTIAQAQEAGVVTLNIGLFINTIINFLIVAFAVFLLVRTMNNAMKRMSRKEEAAPAAPAEPTTEEKLVEAINKLNITLDKLGK